MWSFIEAYWFHLLVGGVILYVVIGKLVCAGLNRPLEERQKQEEQLRIRRAWAPKGSIPLAGITFAVGVRTRDGRKTAFEGALIQALLEKGATVITISDAIARMIFLGEIRSVLQEAPFNHFEGYIVQGAYLSTSTSGGSKKCKLDFRLIDHNQSNRLATEVTQFSEASLADEVVEGIVMCLQERKAVSV